MSHKDDDRFREMLEKIDPSFRKARLEEELDGNEKTGVVGYRARFLQAHSDAGAQGRLVESHKKSIAGPDDTGLADISSSSMQQSLVEARDRTLTLARENERIAWLMVEHLAGEIERVEKQLEEIRVAGLPKPAEKNEEKKK